MSDWLGKNVLEGLVVGYDSKLHTAEGVSKIEENGVALKAVSENIVDQVWQGRPSKSMTQVELFSEKFSGASAEEKIKNIQEQLKEEGADAVLLTMSDSIAWLLNIRGHDIPFIPVALSYAVVSAKGKVQWFIDLNKIGDDIRSALETFVDFYDEEEISDKLLSYKSVMLDEKRTPIYFKNVLEGSGAVVLNKEDPCLMPRACKTEAEQKAMKRTHIRDGVALVKFLKWFEEEAPKGELTELSIEEMLEGLRAQAPEFKEPSFTTIAGYGANGAIVHYRATEETNKNYQAK